MVLRSLPPALLRCALAAGVVGPALWQAVGLGGAEL
jgi:hypothetical protein